MPTLIPDLARTMTDANRRVTDLVDAEIRRAEQSRGPSVEPAALRRSESGAATRLAVAVANEVEQLWASAVYVLQRELPVDEQVAALRAFADLIDSGRDRLKSVCRLWVLVEAIEGETEGAEDLATAARVLDRLSAEARRALEARTTLWQPADPVRLERGRQEIQEGKALSHDEAKARFRTDRG